MSWVTPSKYEPNREAAAHRAAAGRAAARGNKRKVKENLLAAEIIDGKPAAPGEPTDRDRVQAAWRNRKEKADAFKANLLRKENG
jgi:hypothetical protein